MTRYQSPALHPEIHLPAGAVRGLLGLASIALTAALWLAVGSQAGQFGDRDTAVHVTLDPVVIGAHRVLPERPAYAIAGASVDCGNTSAAAGPNKVSLSQ